MEEKKYIGTYDYAQSDTLRPSEESRIHLDNDESGTILASGNHNGVIMEEKKSKNGREQIENDLLENEFNPNEKEESVLRIRKLTGRECYLLMGFDSIDFDRAIKVIPESMIYHTAGDSIIVNVITDGILKNMLR